MTNNKPPDLLAIVIQLSPETSGSIAVNQGRALHKEFLNLVGKKDPTMAERLHSDSVESRKPFTVSDLIGTRDRSGDHITFSAGQPFLWRITSLDKNLSDLLLNKVRPDLQAEPHSFPLGGIRFRLGRVCTQSREHIWAGQTNYENLENLFLSQPRINRNSIKVDFQSPTTFRSRRKNIPLPQPELVFGSWLDKWIAARPDFIHFHAGEEGKEEYSNRFKEFAYDCIGLSYCDIRTCQTFDGHKKEIGFMGKCAFEMLEEDAHWSRVTRMLAEYAFYCGTGAQTSFGFGQTFLI